MNFLGKSRPFFIGHCTVHTEFVTLVRTISCSQSLPETPEIPLDTVSITYVRTTRFRKSPVVEGRRVTFTFHACFKYLWEIPCAQ